jgi:hypothetical protein
MKIDFPWGQLDIPADPRLVDLRIDPGDDLAVVPEQKRPTKENDDGEQRLRDG